MSIGLGHRLRRPVLALAVLLAVAGCTRGDPIAADQAVAHYDAVAEDLTGAIGTTHTEWTLDERTRHVRAKDDVCRYNPGRWTPKPALAIDEDADWDEWIAALNPVLVKDGFQKLHKVDQAEYSQILTTHDSHGAQVEITPDGTLRIWDATVAAKPCADSAVGLGSDG